MPPKRSRRSSSISEDSMSVTDYNEDSMHSGASSISTRRRKQTINSKLKLVHCPEILEKLKTARGSDGHCVADNFLKLPAKRAASEYYDVIKKKIDINKITSKVNSNEYGNFADFESDIELLVNNTKTYHTSHAQEYKDAVLLWHFYEQEKQNIANREDAKIESTSEAGSKDRRGRKRIAISVDDGMSDQISLATSDDSRNTSEYSCDMANPLEQFFNAIVGQKTDGGKDISPTFTFLPSKTTYPQYYDVIKEPIDLRLIAQRIKSGSYLSIDDVERDFLLMIKNAKVFNETKSEVYQDALELHKIVKVKRTEFDNGTLQSKIGRKPKKSRRRKPINLTDLFAKKESPKEESENDGDDESEEQDNSLENCVGIDEELNININDPRYNQWQLYRIITGLNFNGVNPSDPFMKLPSKRLYPEYFLEIMEPMSLLMIKAKIKQSLYKSLDDILRDMDLVFNNAQQFNVEDSGIYKDAVKLQNLAHMKKQDIINLEQKKKQQSSLTGMSQATGSLTHQPGMPNTSSSFPATSYYPGSPLKKPRLPMSPEGLTQKRIYNLYQAVFTYQEDNRFLRDIFMTLPSPEQYPKYYKVIPEPIDLTMIRNKIDENRYSSYMDLVKDLNLLFSNAKHFNEHDSQVFKDAVTLEKLVKKKVKYINNSIVSTSRARNKKLQEASSGSANNASNSSTPAHMKPMATAQQHSINNAQSTNSSNSAPHAFVTPIDYHTPFYRIREIFQTVKEYRDHTNRLLSEPFVKLPSKQEMPEYYEYIRKPIELSTIQHRINNERYLIIDDLMSDLNLMFDNACRFNEPDSQIFLDSLILQRVALEKKTFLLKDDENISDPPNIHDTIQQILETLFNQFYEYQDSDGRYFVDSVNDVDGIEVVRTPIGDYPNCTHSSIVEKCRLNLIKIRGDLIRNRYKRIDRLQDDVFAVLKHVRMVSEVNSQAYDDAYELNKLFITLRDLHCKYGEIILTPALTYCDKHLYQDMETENEERSATKNTRGPTGSQLEPGNDAQVQRIKALGKYTQVESVTSSTNPEVTYNVGDHVKVVIRDVKPQSLRVGEISAIFLLTDSSESAEKVDESSMVTDQTNLPNDKCLIVIRWYYFPQETRHRPTRRFFEREVLQTFVYETISLDSVRSKCFLAYIKDYRENSFKDIKEDDLFICECKYYPEDNSFKKISKDQWTYKENTKEIFVKLETELKIIRHYSHFPTISNNMETNEYNFIIEHLNESVIQEEKGETEPGQKPTTMNYDQYVCDNGFCVKLGDYVYVREGTQKLQIVRIDQLWKNKQDNVSFSGPWFINAMDIEHLPTKVFYKREVFLSSQDPSTHFLSTIVGKCVILCLSDYCKYRPTAYQETSVYVCQFKYFTDDKIARKLKKGLKKVQLSTKALDDEIFFFGRDLVPNKEASPLLLETSKEPLRQEYITRLVCMSPIPPIPLAPPTPITVTTQVNTGAQNSALNTSMISVATTSSFNDDESAITTGDDSSMYSGQTGTGAILGAPAMSSPSPATFGSPVARKSAPKAASRRKNKRNKEPGESDVRKPPSGFVMYAADLRRKLKQENPDALFGDISREVGQMWRNLSKEEKEVYEKKAEEIKHVMVTHCSSSKEARYAIANGTVGQHMNNNNNANAMSGQTTAAAGQQNTSLQQQTPQHHQQQQQQMVVTPNQMPGTPGTNMVRPNIPATSANNMMSPQQQHPMMIATPPHGMNPTQHPQQFLQQRMLLQNTANSPQQSHPGANPQQQQQPVQYIQTANGQLLQFMPPPSQPSSSVVPSPMISNDQQQQQPQQPPNSVTTTTNVQLIQQHLQQHQQQQQQQHQVIYQIASSANQQPIITTTQLNPTNKIGGPITTQQMQSVTPTSIGGGPTPGMTLLAASNTQPNNIAAMTAAPQNAIGQQQQQIIQTGPPGIVSGIPQQQQQHSNLVHQLQQTIQHQQLQIQQLTQNAATAAAATQQQQQQVNFVSVPNRPNRVFHSEIYQRYIERLRRNSPHLSNWRSQLAQMTADTAASGNNEDEDDGTQHYGAKERMLEKQGGPANRQSYMSRLCNEVAPQFLDSKILQDAANNADPAARQDEIVDKLFELRDYLLRDALNIKSRLMNTSTAASIVGPDEM